MCGPYGPDHEPQPQPRPVEEERETKADALKPPETGRMQRKAANIEARSSIKNPANPVSTAPFWLSWSELKSQQNDVKNRFIDDDSNRFFHAMQYARTFIAQKVIRAMYKTPIVILDKRSAIRDPSLGVEVRDYFEIQSMTAITGAGCLLPSYALRASEGLVH